MQDGQFNNTLMAFTTVTTYDGERWDQVAFRAYGDPMQMDVIINANPGVSIDDRLPGGIALVIPIIDNSTITTDTSGLPPWKQ